MAQRLGRETRAKPRLGVADLDAGMRDQIPAGRHARVQGGGPTLFQRVAGADQPPHPIKTKTAQGLTADVQMASVRRVERPPQKPDHLPGPRHWHAKTHLPHPPILTRGHTAMAVNPFAIVEVTHKVQSFQFYRSSAPAMRRWLPDLNAPRHTLTAKQAMATGGPGDAQADQAE